MRLGDVTKVVGGSTPKTGIKEYWNGDIVWITPADLGKLSTREIYSSGRKITQLGYESSGAELVPVKTVVMSSRAPIGHLGIAAVPLCTNQGCKSFIPSESIDSVYLYFVLKQAVPELQLLGRGATFLEISKTQLENYFIPLPPLETQRRIAAILTEQMEAVEKARKAAEEGLEAARKLAGAYVIAYFTGSWVDEWERVPLAEISTFLPAKSIASDGDTEVRAITTACLSESGFRPEGIKTARMWANDAREARISPGEILVARSNTPELVGRVAVYPGGYPDLVASDLTIRIKATGADPAYLGAYLSSLYLSGYWKERAGGASGSMKKITRGQLQDERIPLPNLETQHRIVAELNAKLKATQALIHSLEAQLEAIRALPAAILRRAFSGEL